MLRDAVRHAAGAPCVRLLWRCMLRVARGVSGACLLGGPTGSAPGRAEGTTGAASADSRFPCARGSDGSASAG
eukprot:901376-Alexandrium_andersonii.AAC.1